MAEAEEDADIEGGKKKVGGKKLILFIVLPLLILAGAADGDGEAAGEDAEPLVATPGTYLEVPEMLVSLRSTGRKQQVLKLQINLELESSDDLATIEGFMPKIRDNFQVFLRELRVEELEGSQGIYRVKEEMLARVNEAAHPLKVRDVLISEFIIQ